LFTLRKADATPSSSLPRLAVDDYSFDLGRLEAGAPSTFAQLRFYKIIMSDVFLQYSGLSLSPPFIKDKAEGAPASSFKASPYFNSEHSAPLTNCPARFI